MKSRPALRLLAAVILTFLSPPAAQSRMNVLFIAADDLRCDLGCQGGPALTPHLDALAARGRLFSRAYCQQALCNPSRASLMTGRRPDDLKIWNLSTHFREVAPDLVTLPQHFKQQGYTTLNIGKIFHNHGQQIHGDPVSWSAPAELHWGPHGDDKAIVAGPLPANLAQDPKCENRDVPDEAYQDGRIAGSAAARLKTLQEAGRPFFLAVGFWKPHAPFNAPKRYWHLYDRKSIMPPDHPGWPEGTDRVAWPASREILGWNQEPRSLTAAARQEIRHGYLAAISYLDAQVGRVLDALDRLGLRDSTAVVFWSDHGYHLGENSLWGKTSNFERDARVPLILSHPGIPQPGVASASLVELVDLFPTLTEWCGLPPVPGAAGKSLVPVLNDPAAIVKPAAFTQHPRPAYYTTPHPELMGHSVRTADFRYTEWRDRDGSVTARELYRYGTSLSETLNLAPDPAMAEELRRHAALLEPTAR
jgi:iduronate 2-sulfatase